MLLTTLLLAGCQRASYSCDDPDAIRLARKDATAVETVSFDLQWNDALGIAVGEPVVFALPDDTVSFAATVDLPGVETGFGLVEFSDTVWIDGTLFEGPTSWYSAPYFHWAALGGTVVAPIDAATAPTGCLTLQGATLDDVTGQTGSLHVVTRRGEVEEPTAIDLNLVVVGGTTLFQEDLDDALVVVNQIWSASGGPTLGDVEVFDIAGEPLLRYADSNALRRTSVSGSNPRGVNLFVVQDYLGAAGTLGEAGGIPGPIGLQAVDGAGVIVAMDAHLRADGTIDTVLLGEVMAHEVGHQLGLFHTTESDGTRLDTLADTPDCPADADTNGDAYFTAEECRAFDGQNFMFWSSADFDQGDTSPTQSRVLRQTPIGRAL